MIIGYCGLPGSGKTYALAMDMEKEFKRKRQIFANFPLANSRYFNDFSQILNVRKGIIGADELQMLAPSGFRSLPPSHIALWTQSRHMGIDFWYTVQSFARVDVSIRSVTNFVWEFKRVWGKLHKANLYDAIDIERDRRRAKPLKTRWFYEKEKIYKIYDTSFIVKEASHLAEKFAHCDVSPDSLPVFDGSLKLIE
jgi:zona occludens toxin (predicted ATPase)